jgi:hypothetical protein
MQVVTTVLSSVQELNVGALGAIVDNPEPWW